MNGIYIYIRLILICSALAGAFSLFSQNISGYVFEQKAGEHKKPLPGVNVYWSGTTEGTTTDPDGAFILTSHQLSKMLVISFIGYNNDTIDITGIGEKIEIILTENPELGEVIISGEQNGAYISKLKPIYTQHINSGELRKAACCNLSESFETNASVDVNYADAVSGAKRIELLGLAGIYSQVMVENIPNVRGLSSAYGLTYIPGPWMESIQVSKGSASVLNGYESITGQINAEFKKATSQEKLFLNTYVNDIGKIEANANAGIKVNDRWSSMVFAHHSRLDNETDHNNDYFLDHPLTSHVNIFNRWDYRGNGMEMKLGARYLEDQREGGQLKGYSSENGEYGRYTTRLNARRAELFSKNGILFKDPATSLGLINSFIYYTQDMSSGLNEYNGTQYSLFSNAIFESEITHGHKYNVGAGLVYDAYDESLNDSLFDRKDVVPGVFAQYTYSKSEKLTFIAGARADHHNEFGLFYTTRAHLRYHLTRDLTIRLSAGNGFRTANVVPENINLLASSKNIRVTGDLDPEKAWNFGAVLSFNRDVLGKSLSVNAEYFRTNFVNQVIIDRETSWSTVFVNNLDGKSFSNSYQVEATYEPFTRLEAVVAFRINDVQRTKNGSLEDEPFVNRYKGLVSLSYKTRMKKWQFDYTQSFNGRSDLLYFGEIPQEYRMEEKSPAYTLINLQVTRYFKHWNVYAGTENLTNFTQNHPVISANDPFGPYFDASSIWGPISGRKFYAGFRYQLNRNQ